MVGYWVEEKAHFRPGTFPQNSRTGRIEDVGRPRDLVSHTLLGTEVSLRLGEAAPEAARAAIAAAAEQVRDSAGELIVGLAPGADVGGVECGRSD